ncbi:MAG TPA: flagellar hook assembly protein FlgD [Burkholderiales bacterium]|nr:flagellar hook assembly protein FlgD [Burkholderiales bacterium]
MATVQDASAVSQLAALQSTTTQVANKDEAAANQDRFLTLLVTQLKNQDPLNPMDNSQITTQMAQISTVEGINKLNATLSTMSLAAGADQALQAAAMVGHQVLAAGNAMQLSGSQGYGGYAIDTNADGVTLTIKSASGEVMFTQELGAQSAGVHVFNWDGTTTSGAKALDGAYTFEVTARAGTANAAAQALTMGRVDGVTPGTDGAKFNIGGLGSVSLSDIKQIL